MKSIIGYSLILIALSTSLFLLWKFDLRYYLSFKQTTILSAPTRQLPIEIDATYTSYIHFYDANCPVSRQNLEHFLSFAQNNKDKTHFYLIHRNGNPRHLDSNITYISDDHTDLFNSFNIKSTPSAIVISNKTITYSGNYHSISGLCSPNNINNTAPIIALQATIENNPLPLDLLHLKNAVCCTF